MSFDQPPSQPWRDSDESAPTEQSPYVYQGPLSGPPPPSLPFPPDPETLYLPRPAQLSAVSHTNRRLLLVVGLIVGMLLVVISSVLAINAVTGNSSPPTQVIIHATSTPLVLRWTATPDPHATPLPTTISGTPLPTATPLYVYVTTTPLPTYTALPTYTLNPTYTALPTYTLPPTATPVITSVDDAVQGTGQNQFAYSGSWGHESGHPLDEFRNGTVSYSHTIGDTVTFQFSGNRIKFFTPLKPNEGIAGIRIDGGSEILVDGYSATPTPPQLFYDSGPLNNSMHTVVVRVTGTSNASSVDTFVFIDRADISS